MHRDDLTRRDFSKLTAAAFSGIAAGGSIIEADAAEDDNPFKGKDLGPNPALMLKEPHVCKGLNACKGKGGCATSENNCAGKNACAGRAGCPTAKKHSCAGKNTCKGQGGCGDYPGQNTCKGKGNCAVPLSPKAWKKARSNFEKIYKAKHGKAPGGPPKKHPGAKS